MSWKDKATWPVLWLVALVSPLMKWISAKVDRWLDNGKEPP